MDIQKEREDFEKLWTDGNGHFKFFEFDQDACKYRLNGVNDNLPKEDLLSASITLNTAWLFWLGAKKRAVPEGFVLVPRVPTEEMIQIGAKANSECLNDNAPLGERLYRYPATQVYAAMVAGLEKSHD